MRRRTFRERSAADSEQTPGLRRRSSAALATVVIGVGLSLVMIEAPASAAPDPAGRVAKAIESANARAYTGPTNVSAQSTEDLTPANSGQSIRLGSAVSIGLPAGSGGAVRRKVVGDTAVYTGVKTASSFGVRVGDDAIQITVEIEGPDAATEFAFPLGLEAGQRATLSDGPTGSVQIRDRAGVLVQSFLPPWALDANGASVPTWYELRGSATLVQHVQHAGAAYPVVADPTASCGIISCTMYFNKSETERIAVGAIGVTAIVALCALTGGPYAGAACLIVGADFALGAQNARSLGKCMKMKWYVFGGVAGWPSSYSGGNCR